MSQPLDYARPRPPAVWRPPSALVLTVWFLVAAVACAFLGNWGLHAEFNVIPFAAWIGLGLAATLSILRDRHGTEPRARRIAIRVLFSIALVLGVFSWVGALNVVDPHVITRNRYYCALHLRHVGLALTLYADGHHGRFPDTLLELAKNPEVELDPIAFTCPGVQPMGYQSHPTTQAIFADLASPTASPFVYRGKGLTNRCSSKTVIAHDRLNNHANDTGPRDVHVLLADGNVLDLSPRQAEKLVRELDAGHNPPPEDR